MLKTSCQGRVLLCRLVGELLPLRLQQGQGPQILLLETHSAASLQSLYSPSGGACSVPELGVPSVPPHVI